MGGLPFPSPHLHPHVYTEEQLLVNLVVHHEIHVTSPVATHSSLWRQIDSILAASCYIELINILMYIRGSHPCSPNPGLTRLGFRPTLVKSLDWGAASSGTGWGMGDALLSEEVQHPTCALGVPYLEIQNLQGSQGHSALGV